MRMLPQLRRNGFRAISRHLPVRLFKALLSDQIETLMKGGEIEVMKHFLSIPVLPMNAGHHI